MFTDNLVICLWHDACTLLSYTREIAHKNDNIKRIFYL